MKIGQQLEVTAKEVLSHRQRYQAKAEASKEVRRRRNESNMAKTLVPEKQHQVPDPPLAHLGHSFSTFYHALEPQLPETVA